MTINAKERSVYDAAPQELYWFNVDALNYYFTDWDQDVTNSNLTYLCGTPHKRNEPELSEEVKHAQLQIMTVREHPIVQLILTGAPHDPIWVSVFRRMYGDSENADLRWQGKVVSFSINENDASATLICEPVEAIFGKSAFRHTYGPMCRKRLYSIECGVSQAAMQQQITVSNISADGLTITAPELAGKPVNWWRYGYLWFQNIRRYGSIVSSSGSNVVLRTPITGLKVDEVGKAYPGCDHVWKKSGGTWGDCKDKFDNTINFGGMPFTPNKNPYTVGLEG